MTPSPLARSACSGRTVSRLALVLALSVPAHAAHAGETADAGKQSRADIVVTGTGLAPLPGEAALSIVTLDRERLRDSGTERLESVLGEIAGFQSFRRSDSRSAHPTSQGAGLRALGGNASSRALVMLDGVPQDDPFGGWVSWSAIDPKRLAGVRVTRGGGLGSHGAGALAGVIELDSISGDELGANGSALPLMAELAYGSRDSLSASALVGGTLGRGAAFLSARHDRGDGFTPVAEGQRGAADRPAGYRQTGLAGRAAIAVGETSELQANMAFFDDVRDRGFDYSDSHIKGADASLRYIKRAGLPMEILAYAKLREFRTNFASVNADRSMASQVLDQTTPSTGYGARVRLRPDLGAITMDLGADVAVRDGETRELFTFVAGEPTRDRRAGGRNVTAGLFGGLDWRLGDRLILTATGRLDQWWIDDAHLLERNIATGAAIQTVTPSVRDGLDATGRIALAWQVAPRWTVRTAAYNSFRLPTLNELYRPFRVGADGTAANPFLTPERLKGVEGGIDWRDEDGNGIGVTAYWNWLDHAIANVEVAKQGNQCAGVGFVGGICRQRQNLDQVKAFGIEVDGQWRTGPWRAALSYAYGKAEIRAFGSSAMLNGLTPSQTPRHQLNGRIGWQNEQGFAAHVAARFQSSRFEDDMERIRLRPALTVDAGLSLPLTQHLSLGAMAENIGNRTVEASRSDSGIVERANPRTFWVSIRYR